MNEEVLPSFLLAACWAMYALLIPMQNENWKREFLPMFQGKECSSETNNSSSHVSCLWLCKAFLTLYKQACLAHKEFAPERIVEKGAISASTPS